MIPLKSDNDLKIIREAGKILKRILKELEGYVAVGMSTGELNAEAERLFLKEKAIPAFKGYKGFPAAICTSVNEEIVHGIPGDRKLFEGDIIGIDAGISYNGFFADAAVTIAVGKIDPLKNKLIEVARRCLGDGIKQARPGNRLFDISYSIQALAEDQGFSVVRHFVGHGIGRMLHEEPEIPNFGKAHEGPLLKSGMVLAIEPMINAGTWEAEITENGWTAVTSDGLPSAHFEHTVAITEAGPEIIT